MTWRYEQKSWWKRWPVIVWLFVSLGIMLIARAITGLFKASRKTEPGASSSASDAALAHHAQSKEDVRQELSRLGEKMDRADATAEQAKAAAHKAAQTREEQHAAIDAATDGDAVDAVLYGHRTDD